MRSKKTAATGSATRRLLELAGNPKTVEKAICIVADHLLEGVACPPTDIDAILTKLNIRSCDPEPLPISGQLRRAGKHYRIVYSSYLTPERRRFTIAHELGHAVLESTGRNCPRKGEEVETLCDALAVEFLMPRKVFFSCIGNQASLERLLELKKVFQTSLHTTAKRLGELSSACTFAIEKNNVVWTSHQRVPVGNLRRIDEALQTVINAGIESTSGEDKFYFDADPRGWWRVQWLKIANQNRFLFQLLPISSETGFTDAAFKHLRTVKEVVSTVSP